MQKLYKRVGRQLRYHEAWAHGQSVIEHWGIVGERGQTATHQLPKGWKLDALISQVLRRPSSDGYVTADEIGESILLIEYTIEGIGSPKDLKKRHALEARMDETLGWTGLGHCDGGSIGSGTMEVCCVVVDFDVAKRVIAEDLAGTEFADFRQIYDEDAE